MNMTNVSVTLTWDNPGGNVSAFIIQLVSQDMTFNITVSGALTSHALLGLEPDSSYNVVVFTVNSLGRSVASPIHFITTGSE